MWWQNLQTVSIQISVTSQIFFLSCGGFEKTKQCWSFHLYLDGCFQKIWVPQNGQFIMDNPIKMDDLGVPLFLETST